MTVKQNKEFSRYWFISSCDCGDIGLDMVVKVDMDSALAYYQNEMLDWSDDIEIYPCKYSDLCLSGVDIL